MAVRTLQKDLAHLGTKCSSAEKVLESIIEALGLRSSARWAGWGFQERFNLYCSVAKLLGDRAIVEFVSAWPSSCLAVDLEVLKHDVLLSSCLAGRCNC